MVAERREKCALTKEKQQAPAPAGREICRFRRLENRLCLNFVVMEAEEADHDLYYPGLSAETIVYHRILPILPGK